MMNLSKSTEIVDTLAIAEKLLSNVFSLNITLKFLESLSSQFLVLRVQIIEKNENLPKTVIIKRIYTKSNDTSSNEQLKNRFLNELASLEFLKSLNFEPIIFPNLLTYDIEKLLLIMNDIGSIPSVMSILTNDSYEIALNALTSYSKTLALLHGLTLDKKNEFTYFQNKFGSFTPKCDSNIKFTNYSDQFAELFQYAKGYSIYDQTIIFNELIEIENKIHNNKVLQSFIHCDSGPQNVLYSENTFMSYLLDYEFGGYGFSFLDMAGPRIAFQQSLEGMRIPESNIIKIEREYFIEINKYLKQKLSNTEFNEIIWLASSQWVIGRLGYYLKNVLLPILRSNNKEDKTIQFSKEQINDLTTKIYTLLIEYIRTTNELCIDSKILPLVELTRDEITKFWPSINPLAYFNSLKT